MISLEDISMKKKEISSLLLKAEPESVCFIINEYLKWMQEKYDEMDEKAKEYAVACHPEYG